MQVVLQQPVHGHDQQKRVAGVGGRGEGGWGGVSYRSLFPNMVDSPSRGRVRSDRWEGWGPAKHERVMVMVGIKRGGRDKAEEGERGSGRGAGGLTEHGSRDMAMLCWADLTGDRGYCPECRCAPLFRMAGPYWCRQLQCPQQSMSITV